MSKNFTNTLFFFAVTLILIVTGCGSSDSPTASVATNASQSKVFGVASLGTTATTTVTVKDSSMPTQEKTAALSSNGSFTADVSGLKAPFILKASGIDQAGDHYVLYSVSANGGRANINELSDTAVAAAAEDDHAADRDMLYSMSNNEDNRRTSERFEQVINRMRTVLAPLFALYQITGNPVTDEDGGEDDSEHNSEHDNRGLRALLRDVQFKVINGNVLVTNRATDGNIFTGPLGDLASGTFHPENMPAGPGGLTTCNYTYSDWGACQSDSSQTRTMLTSSPSGCTGSPVLSQACAEVPPTSSACTSFTYSAWGTCQSNGTQTRTLATSSPTGCTGGTLAALSQSCTYVPPVTACTSFTYSTWGACQSNSTQSRTVVTSSPTGCTGGTPALSQSCTYVPPVTACTSFTYSTWGACQSNSTQSRTVVTSSPTGCTGGTPALSQSCTYVPPTPACGSCHTIPPSTGKHSFHTSRGIACSTCHGAGYSSTTVAATHDNGVTNTVSSLNFSAGTCGSPGCHGSRSW